MTSKEHLQAPIGHFSPAALPASSLIEPNLTPEQTADWLGISKPTLQRMRTDGSGPPYIKLGRRVLYQPSALSRWVAAHAVTSTADARERLPMKPKSETGLAA